MYSYIRNKEATKKAHELNFTGEVIEDDVTKIETKGIQFAQNCFYIDSEKRMLVSYTVEDEDNGLLLHTDYVDKRCLAYRQYKVLKAGKIKYINYRVNHMKIYIDADASLVTGIVEW